MRRAGEGAGILADAVDGLLERLDSAFDAQKRFVVNAAHALRME
jgi:hypothetical protein